MKPSRPVRVIIAEDHPIFLAGLRSTLIGIGACSILAATDDGARALELSAEMRPEVLVVGLTLRGLASLEVVRRLTRSKAKTVAIVFVSHDAPGFVRQLMKAGARGCLLRHAPPGDLLRAIDIVRRGGTFMSPEIASAFFAANGAGIARPFEGSILTPREIEVIAMVADGHTTKRIAQELKLSPRTVLTHRENLMQKLGIHNVAGLTRHAVAHGIVPLACQPS